MPASEDHFWKTKLAAFLHDPPSKCVDLRLHEQAARTLYRQAGFVDEEEIRRLSDAYAKPSDWTASAADRFPFPKSRGNLASVFDGVRSRFHHPLSADQPFAFHAEFASAAMAMEVDSTLQPTSQDIDGWTTGDQWRARYFCHWRLWEKFCTEKDYRFAFLPADTRIPDHSVWTHMQVVSALDGCADGTGKDAVLKPAFLKFQLGPVQDFIAEARSIRDLWSGSYLLSWLMAAGMKALAMEVGPDSVIFPNLKGQPLFDLHLRDSLWSQVNVNGKSVWDHLALEKNTLLTPNLPNVFLAVVHRDRAQELGQLVEKAIRNEWKKIAAAVWQYCEDADMIPADETGFKADERKARFDRQVSQFLALSWQATPWPESLEDTMKLADSFDKEMPIKKAAKRINAIIDYATRTMPEADRDGRCYVGGDNGPKNQLNNIGLGWSVILAFNGWQLDAVRQTRNFDAWSSGGWEIGTFSNKDSLGGRAEAVAGGKDWTAKAKQKGGAWKSLFKHEDWLGASNLIKRLWHLAYLEDKWGLPTASEEFPMPNTHKIAAHQPFESGDDEDEEKLSGEKYFAVLALDGDEIGKWVSGEKTPPFGAQFSCYADANGVQQQGARKYFADHGGATLLATRRALSPSYHLQFSQALSNFALLCARPIVEAHDGRLIYSGGDDVLAMLPADAALECAQALRLAFQGNPQLKDILQATATRLRTAHENAKPPREVPRAVVAAADGKLLDAIQPGYVSIVANPDQSRHPITFPVPGKDAEVSVGIAIAHFKSPLQDVVRAAQKAEKHAKNSRGRAAFAVTLMKRSGEITEWGAKWQSGGLELYTAIAQALECDSVSSKFPHRVCQLLEPYRHRSDESSALQDAADFNAKAIIIQEFSFAVSRKSAAGRREENAAALLPKLGIYLDALGDSPQTLLKAIDGLCTAVAFAHRTRNEPADRQPA
ncbi:MAG: type III-B CRISPR-associated protein Cas10/Cmr2 [Verrucomicrobia bacterium]|nr:type III-B CRISPR-associated protein Cas10/Cmr2 [Verrucomicrobiota bacterium]